MADVFPRSQGGAESMAAQFDVPFLGRVPLDPRITRACEAGTSYTAGVRQSGGRDLLLPLVKALRATEPPATQSAGDGADAAEVQ